MPGGALHLPAFVEDAPKSCHIDRDKIPLRSLAKIPASMEILQSPTQTIRVESSRSYPKADGRADL